MQIGFFQADAITGPYTFVRTQMSKGVPTRGTGLFLDDDASQTPYIIFANGPTFKSSSLVVANLTDDYTSIDTEIVTLDGYMTTLHSSATMMKIDKTYYIITADLSLSLRPMQAVEFYSQTLSSDA